MEPAKTFVPREECPKCGRPKVVCYCAHIRPIRTATRVVILQHPRERTVAIGTARMASLCLTDAELIVGKEFRTSSALRRAIGDPARPPILLYPAADAVDVADVPPPGPVTLVVVDGTWRQAQNLVRHTPELQHIPRYAFRPEAPSEYRIRKEPAPHCVSTIEAIMYMLGALEGEPERFRALLEPFRAMVDAQIGYEARNKPLGSRHRKFRESYVRRPRVPESLLERERLVCLIAEANAWPERRAEQPKAYPDELVQLTAVRLGSGETLDVVLRPAHPVAPRIPDYIEQPLPALEAGMERGAALEAWRRFLRPDDVLCVWGTYGIGLLRDEGAALPARAMDLRLVARALRQRRPEEPKLGALEDYADALPGEAGAPARLGTGRAGTRLAKLVRVAEHLARVGQSERAGGTPRSPSRG